MIKDFTTYIHEGRMSRLVNADSTSPRKEDLSISLKQDIINLINAYFDKDAKEEIEQRLTDLVTRYDLLPHIDEWTSLILSRTISKDALPPVVHYQAKKACSRNDIRVFLECHATFRTPDGSSVYGKVFSIERLSGELDQVYIYLNSKKYTAWTDRLETILQEQATTLWGECYFVIEPTKERD